MRRREFLQAAVAAPLAAACGTTSSPRAPGPMPALFVAHGSPELMDDAGRVGELRTWATGLPTPTGILVLSAHWEADPITVGATHQVPLLHDFDGFPDRYMRVTYPAPSAPALADRVTALLRPSEGEVRAQRNRGLDHGAYVPLLAMYPDAQVPVLQLSLPSLHPTRLFAIGRALAPLRREGVLILGSGFLTHNVFAAYLDAPRDVVKEAWASEFDHWAAEVLARRDVDALLDWTQKAPAVDQAHLSHEHFAPVIATLGASIDQADARITFPITGWFGGTFTRRSVQIG